MNSAWWKTLIIISLGLNCLIAGAFAYRFVSGRPIDRFFGGPRAGMQQFMRRLPPERIADHDRLREKMAGMREQINAARAELLDMLAEPEPDRGHISGQLSVINKLQADMERMAVDQMLQDVQALPPEKRLEFLNDIRRGYFFRMGDGHGRGRGRHGRHRPGGFFSR